MLSRCQHNWSRPKWTLTRRLCVTPISCCSCFAPVQPRQSPTINLRSNVSSKMRRYCTPTRARLVPIDHHTRHHCSAQMSSEGNGITLTGFRKAVLASDITAAPSCVEALFRQLDPNGDGRIQFSEFMRGVMGEEKSLAGQDHIEQMRHDSLLATKMHNTQMRSDLQEKTSQLLQVC